MELSLLALVLGFMIDLLLGDPRRIYHPIRLVGNLIGFLEKNLNDGRKVKEADSGETPKRRRKQEKMKKENQRDPRAEFLWGVVMAVLVILLSSGIPLFILILADKVHPMLRLAVETVMCWQLLATKSLRDESTKVFERLQEKDLEGGRYAVSMIVGRDTQRLDETGVTKAAVETVAENTSDGIVAPMFYMAIGGAALGFFYKAVNTMDSMVGYKNERYLYFGKFAARLDDALNFIPARLSALFMIAAAFFTKMDGQNAWKMFKRDRYNHASPNSAQTEAVMAGALDIQLAGDAWYFGKLYKKKTIGDDIRPVKPTDILRANILLYATAFIALAVFSILKALVIFMIL